MRCINNFLTCFDRFRDIDLCQIHSFTCFYIYCTNFSMNFKTRGVYVTSLSTEHTIIDLFFEDTFLQVIRLWNTVISFRFWVIYDDVEML
jgi:hypothetical protein